MSNPFRKYKLRFLRKERIFTTEPYNSVIESWQFWVDVNKLLLMKNRQLSAIIVVIIWKDSNLRIERSLYQLIILRWNLHNVYTTYKSVA